MFRFGLTLFTASLTAGFYWGNAAYFAEFERPTKKFMFVPGLKTPQSDEFWRAEARRRARVYWSLPDDAELKTRGLKNWHSF